MNPIDVDSKSPARSSAPNADPDEVVPCTLAQLLGYFLKLGTTSFGGPIALTGYMQRDLVEQHRWISKRDYREGLALAQLAPGPLAAQLAIYLGWVRSGILGATLVGLAFVIPSFLMVLVLSLLYVRAGGLPWMRGVFYGIGAAVIAIIVRSAYKLTRLTLGKDRLLWLVFAVSAVVTAWTETESVWLFVASGLLVWFVRRWPSHRSACFFPLLPTWLGFAADAPASWLLSGLHGAPISPRSVASPGTSRKRARSSSAAGSRSSPSYTAALSTTSIGSTNTNSWTPSPSR